MTKHSEMRRLDSLSADEIGQAYRYCRDLTMLADTNFALGFHFLPKRKRDAIYAIYAFNRCADDFVDDAAVVQDAQRLIAEWSDALDACYEGRVGHPVMIAFADAVRRYHVPRQPFLDALEGFKMDLTIRRYRTFDDLAVYCERVAATISTMSLCVFGYTDPEAAMLGRDLSMALQLTNIIRDVGDDIHRDRIYIPLDEIARFGYTEEELLARIETGSFRALMSYQVERALSYFRRANALVPLLDRDARLTTWLMGSVYAAILQKIIRSGYRVFDGRTALNKREKGVVMLRSIMCPCFTR